MWRASARGEKTDYFRSRRFTNVFESGDGGGGDTRRNNETTPNEFSFRNDGNLNGYIVEDCKTNENISENWLATASKGAVRIAPLMERRSEGRRNDGAPVVTGTICGHFARFGQWFAFARAKLYLRVF